jgi:CO/xanthine dehydrogenase FAD-binding subunit
MPNDSALIDWVAQPPAAACALSQPFTAAAALDLRRACGPEATYIAGGTALQLGWGVAEEQRPSHTLLIDVLAGAVPAGVHLDVLPDGSRALRLGAAARLEALRRDARVRAAAPRLAEAFDAIAAPAVRHLATLGGNIGWRCGDALPALLAAGAWLTLAEGTRVPLDRMLDEARAGGAALPLIAEVCWPLARAPRPGWSIFEKIGWRAAFSPSRLTLAIEALSDRGVIAEPRVAATAAGWPARRLTRVERVLVGLTPEALRRDAGGLRAACLADLDDSPQARLVTRLLTGHLSREAMPHG